MTVLSSLMLRRRSCRRFTDEPIAPDQVQVLLQSALAAPTSHGRGDVHFVVVDSSEKLQQLADCKDAGASFVKLAALAIVVASHPQTNDCWIEDCSIAAFAIQLQAEELGLGTCWVQLRNRGLSDGHSANEVIRGILDLPEDLSTPCLIAVGHPAKTLPPHDEDNLKWENVTISE